MSRPRRSKGVFAMKRLRDAMREDLALRGMSPATIRTYVRCARRFVEYYGGRSPNGMGETEVRAYLLYLVEERHVRARTFNVYAAALRFLYAGEQEKVGPSREQGRRASRFQYAILRFSWGGSE
jgi:hypothetical protein